MLVKKKDIFTIELDSNIAGHRVPGSVCSGVDHLCLAEGKCSENV